MECVRTYSPATEFVVMEGLADMRKHVLTDIQISVWGYQYLPPLALSA